MRKKLSRRRLRRLSLESLEGRRLLAQMAVAVPDAQAVEVNDTIKITTDYSTIPEMQTAGVSLRLHYNPSLVSFDVSDITIPPLPNPQTQGNPFIDDDTDDGDNDPTTTKFVQVDFIDFSGTFPAEVSPLFDAMFTATAVGTANFNYSFNDAVGATDSTGATVTINELPTVTLGAPSSDMIAEGQSPNSVAIAVNLSAASDEVVTVPFTIEGTATNGTDYTITTVPVTILAGLTSSNIIIDVIDDTEFELIPETVRVSLGTPAGGMLGDTTSQSVMITDNDLPTVTLGPPSSATIEEGESPGTVTIPVNLSAANDEVVTVPFTVTGTAIDGTDYMITTSPVTISAGTTSANIIIDVIDDTEFELIPETVIVSLGTPAGGILGDTTLQTVIITDNDLPTVTLGPPSPATIEEGESPRTVTIPVNLSAATNTVVTIPFAVTGTATNGIDYTITMSPVMISAGATSANIIIDVIDDSEFELIPETVVVDLGTPTGGILGLTVSQTVMITDNDFPAVTLGAPSPGTIREGQDPNTVTIPVILSETSDSEVTVPFTVTGTATDGSDFTIATSPITIAAGETSATITITVIDDRLEEDSDEVVIITLGTPDGAVLGNTIIQTVTILDREPPNATLSGLVFLDVNENGIRDANEVGIPGAFIDLTGIDVLGKELQLRAMTADDGSYAFVDLNAGDYTITERQPGAFRDGVDTIGSQGGDAGEDLFEITELLANDVGRNNNFGESGLAPGQFSKRFFLSSTDLPTLYRELNAKHEELNGDPEDAELIRTIGIPSVVSASDEIVNPVSPDAQFSPEAEQASPEAEQPILEAEQASPEAEQASQTLEPDTEAESSSIQSIAEAEGEQTKSPQTTIDEVMTSMAEAENADEVSALDDHADVDGDGAVTTRDALILMNRLYRSGEGEDEDEDAGVTWKLDTNRDGSFTAKDVLYVINRLE